MTDISYICKWLLAIGGTVFLLLVAWLPYRIDQMREHAGDGLSVVFTPGFESIKEALTSLITAFSILSTISCVFIVLPLINAKMPSSIALLLSALTFIAFSSGIVWSLYLYLIRPLSGTAPSAQDIYWDLRILLIGLSLTMYTITAIIHES